MKEQITAVAVGAVLLLPATAQAQSTHARPYVIAQTTPSAATPAPSGGTGQNGIPSGAGGAGATGTGAGGAGGQSPSGTGAGTNGPGATGAGAGSGSSGGSGSAASPAPSSPAGGGPAGATGTGAGGAGGQSPSGTGTGTNGPGQPGAGSGGGTTGPSTSPAPSRPAGAGQPGATGTGAGGAGGQSPSGTGTGTNGPGQPGAGAGAGSGSGSSGSGTGSSAGGANNGEGSPAYQQGVVAPRFQPPTPSNSGIHFAEIHYIVNPSVYNPYNAGLPGNQAGPSIGGKAAFEFGLKPLNFGGSVGFMISGSFHSWNYPHAGPTLGTALAGAPCTGFTNSFGCVTNPGQLSQSRVLQANEQDTDAAGHLGIGFTGLHTYIAAAYTQRGNNRGGPNIQGFGVGIEKLPEVDRPFGIHGSAYYYPQVGAGSAIQYRLYTYDVGLTANLYPIGFKTGFVDLGFEGDRGNVKSDASLLAPGNFQHSGPYAGIGVRF